MRNEVCVIEIKNKSLRLLIGYIFDDQVKVVYSLKKKLTVALNDGDVLDVGSLTNDLISIAKIDDKELNFKYLIKEAIVVIPSFGLEVYNNSQTTNIISAEGIIEPIDIKNVHSLMEKIIFPNENNMLINIVPNSFTIANQRPFTYAPLGQKSPFINLNANLYTMPKKFISDLYTAFRNANIDIKKAYVSSLCATAALRRNDFKYQQYVMVHIGSKNTIVTLVDKEKVIASRYFSYGSENLTTFIMNQFRISYEDAEMVKKTFGYEVNNREYKPVLAQPIADNASAECTRVTLNVVVGNHLRTMCKNIRNAISTLFGGREEYINKTPIILFGSALKLKGLKEELRKTFVNNTIEFPKSNVVGASYDDFINEVGAIYLDQELEKNFVDKTKPSTKNNSLLTREVD